MARRNVGPHCYSISASNNVGHTLILLKANIMPTTICGTLVLAVIRFRHQCMPNVDVYNVFCQSSQFVTHNILRTTVRSYLFHSGLFNNHYCTIRFISHNFRSPTFLPVQCDMCNMIGIIAPFGEDFAKFWFNSHSSLECATKGIWLYVNVGPYVVTRSMTLAAKRPNRFTCVAGALINRDFIRHIPRYHGI